MLNLDAGSGLSLGDYDIDTSSTSNFDISDYIDMDDSGWDTSFDSLFADLGGSDDYGGPADGNYVDDIDAFYGGIYGQSFEDAPPIYELYSMSPAERKEMLDEYGLPREYGSKASYWNDSKGEFEHKSGDEGMEFNEETLKWEKGGDDDFWGSLFKNEGMLKALMAMGAAGLGFIGKSQEADLAGKQWEDRMKLEREKMQHDMDMYNLKMSYKTGRGGGGGAAPDAARNAALASVKFNYGAGDFTKR